MPDESPLDQMRAEIARLERHTQTILESAGEGIYGLDSRGAATFVNPAAARMLGWSVEELVGEMMHANHHHSHEDGTTYTPETCPIYAAIHDGEVHCVEHEVFWRRDGSSFPVEYTSTPILEDGKPKGAVVVFRDTTQRRRAEAEIRALKEQLEAENTYLQEQILSDFGSGEILGESAATSALRQSIETVAPTDATVLVHGETGTGKELVARAIHAHGPRRHKPLIKVNCASIPRDLFESEFFGHVKGAFTGAMRDRQGRFELAHGAAPKQLTGAVLTEAEVRQRERDNLIAALEQCEGRVYGENGAAELLGIKPTTLASRIKKLGVSPRN